MENRAVKHVARQDGVLLRAVARVWKARERGRLLERVKATRLLKAAWAAWEHRMQEQKQNSSKDFWLPSSYDVSFVAT